MNTLFARGFVDLLFSVIKQHSSFLLAVNHDDESPLNRRAARIACMAHNRRSLLEHAAPHDPLLALGTIESEAMSALRETREPQDAVRLRAIVETAQCRYLLGRSLREDEKLARRVARRRAAAEELPRPVAAASFVGSDTPALRQPH